MVKHLHQAYLQLSTYVVKESRKCVTVNSHQICFNTLDFHFRALITTALHVMNHSCLHPADLVNTIVQNILYADFINNQTSMLKTSLKLK